MNRSAPAIGIDFGTSNSAVASVQGDSLARLLPLEGSATTMPTAVFFNAEERSTHFGREAIALYLAGTEGRLMRSLKSLLGTPLMQDQTEIGNEKVSFEDIIALFLHELAKRAQAQFGAPPAQVVIGRPVRFVDDDDERDRQAEAALRRAARHAGLGEVRFQYEPIAAAFDYERRIDREALVLIVDIGGGTSDFTVVRLGPKRVALADRSGDLLATAGVHIGGTDFDQRLSLECVMPHLGFRHIGPRGREVPSKSFFDLSSWHLINWLYAPRAIRQVQELRINYADTRLHDRLVDVLVHRHGHRIANEVEQAKIRSGTRDEGDGVAIDLSCAQAGLASALTARDMRRHLATPIDNVVSCARDCVQRANLGTGRLDAIYLTGGSSALRPFQQALRDAFPGTELIEGDLFGGVAAGLAYAAAGARAPQAA
ncbi:Hsp70 family protein [Variovorax sp. PBL-E5]|uniref:Hsp70 family protein n=1 Tax=Variovorax sp. PBL-E5 TaxID=434014 RepID=UPI0013178CF7|nr:Hsp70 family protein [Variovorax sp. PBL-E5]VTU35072.1 Heat shock protein 70 [Variovorax sp. PBL-E5]